MKHHYASAARLVLGKVTNYVTLMDSAELYEKIVGGFVIACPGLRVTLVLGVAVASPREATEPSRYQVSYTHLMANRA